MSSLDDEKLIKGMVGCAICGDQREPIVEFEKNEAVFFLCVEHAITLSNVQTANQARKRICKLKKLAKKKAKAQSEFF